MHSRTIRYIAGKAGQMILSLAVLSLLVFLVSRLAPGDPLRAYYGDAVERMSAQQLAAAEERLGLKEPLLVQYADWVRNALQGDFGISYQYKRPALSVISQVFGNTMALAGCSFVMIFFFGILLAVFCVRREGSRIDRVICKVGIAANSVPEFFIALILMAVFGATLGWLPQSGASSLGESGVADRLLHLILPTAAMVVSHLWYCTYLIRNKLSDEMGKEYVLLCKVKGLSERRIVFWHCLRNILPAIVSIMAIFLPHLLGGAYVVEMVFSYPGLGKLGVESAQYHDYNMLMLVALITGAMVITAGMAAQVVNEKLAPEIREERGRML